MDQISEELLEKYGEYNIIQFIQELESLKSERSGKHYQGNVFDIIGDSWDIMIVHPPCRCLSYAGTSSWNDKERKKKRN